MNITSFWQVYREDLRDRFEPIEDLWYALHDEGHVTSFNYVIIDDTIYTYQIAETKAQLRKLDDAIRVLTDHRALYIERCRFDAWRTFKLRFLGSVIGAVLIYLGLLLLRFLGCQVNMEVCLVAFAVTTIIAVGGYFIRVYPDHLEQEYSDALMRCGRDSSDLFVKLLRLKKLAKQS